MAPSDQDGRYAWLVCAASFLVQIVYGGLLNSMGVLYIMFQNGLDAGDSALSLVTSINLGVSCLVCKYSKAYFIFKVINTLCSIPIPLAGRHSNTQTTEP